MRATEESLVGRVLGGEFELRALLARGGQATVYRAYSRDRDTEVAVKILSPTLSRDPDFRIRFLDEFRSLARLHHENLVEVYRYGVEDDLVYIAMRMVSGGTLTDRLSVLDGPVDLVTTARIISQVAAALQHAHDHGLVHLDIKPSNILLGRADWPLLADFGITRAVARQETGHGNVRIAGTPLFMSPEQCQGGPLDGRSDQYSLAITAYEMLTGQLPFQATTTEQLLDDHQNRPPPRPREVNPGLPAPVEEVLLRGMAKDPDDRYPTIQDFGDALRLAVAQTHGVSLETKAALAGLAPTVIAFLGLIILAPVLLASVPDVPVFGVPLNWPFSVLVSLILVGTLLRARWYLVGLLARALGALADLARPEPGRASGAALSRWARWRKRLIGAADGVVSLAYIFAVYQLVLSPVAQLTRALVPTGAGSIGSAVAIGLAAIVTVVILAGMVRSVGPIAAVGFLILLGAFVVGGLAGLAGSVGGSAAIAAVPALAALVVLASWLPIRRGAQSLLVGPVLRLILQDGSARPPELRDTQRRRVGKAIGSAADLALAVLLLILLLRGASLADGQLPGAWIIAAGVALVVWFVLSLRLAMVSGWSWLAFAFLVGVPLFSTVAGIFPEAAGGITMLGGAAPRVAVTWAAAGTAALLLLVSRSSWQRRATRPVAAWAERQLVGPIEAPGEDAGARRGTAFAGLVGALGDVALLIIAFWLVGPPLITTLNGSGSSPWLFGAVLSGLTLLIGGVLFASLARARDTLVSTGAMDWARGGALPFLALGSAAFIVAGGAAAPTVVANPEVAGLAIQPRVNTVPYLVVGWQFWQPRTPSADEATYNVAISCSNGDRFGEFREAFRPAGGMPNGTIAAPSLGTTSCADWQSLYFALRRSAGVNATTSLSRSWLDERITLHPDGSADVVETQRVTFTAGSFSHLDWDLPTAAGESVTNVQLREGDLVYAFDPAGPASRSAHLIAEGNDPRLAWSFPTIESPAERTYTITYHLTGATHHSNADTIFERQVVSPRESGPVWRTTVEIELPASVPANAVRLDSTGAPTRHDIVDGHTAWFEGTDLSAVSTLTVKLSLPAGFGSSVPPASSPAPTASVPTTAGVAGTPSRTATPTLGPSATPTATGTPSSTPTVTDTVTPGPANASALTATVLAASSPSSTPTATATLTPTSVLTPSATPSNTPVAKASPTPTSTGAGGLATTCGQAPVLAMYYDWYDAKSWNSTLSDQPVAPYVSADRATIERQVTQAQSVGIDGFEVNWWGPNNQTDTNLQTLLSVARAHNFKVTVDFDLNSPFVTNNDQLTADIKYLSRYYADPAWFHYQGKPFIVFYGVSRQPVAAWATIRQQADPNQQVFWMGEGVQFTYLSVFDGIHPYSIAFSASPGSVLASYARQTRAYPGKVWMATAMPGYNDVGVNGSKGYVRDRANGAYYQSSWNGAVATNPDIINITSFNEWTEGSMIEPSKSYGDLYLNLTKQFIGAYRAGQGC